VLFTPCSTKVALSDLPRGEHNTPHKALLRSHAQSPSVLRWRPQSPSRLGDGRVTRNPQSQRFPSATKYKSQMHTLGSQSLTQISTKLERERKGKRWIFNLSSTPTKGTQSLLEISAEIMRKREREERRTLTCLLSKCENEGEKLGGSGLQPPKYPQLTLLAVGALRSELNRNIRVGQEKYPAKFLWLHTHPLE